MKGRYLNILFWNLNNKNLYLELSDIIEYYNIDIAIVVESNNLNRIDFLKELNKHSSKYFDANTLSLSDRIQFYTKFHPKYLKPIHEDESDRFSFRLLTLPKTKNIIIGGLHLPDPRNYSIYSRNTYSTILKGIIEEQELKLSTSETLLLGDFNMNPFDEGMNHTNCLNAVMNKTIAKRRGKKVLSQRYSFFYNPSWSLMGDLNNGTSGTYYYNKPGYDSYYWNTFDQVLLRPNLIENFDDSSFSIVTNTPGIDLTSRSGLINRVKYSDHYPIKFTLKNLE